MCSPHVSKILFNIQRKSRWSLQATPQSKRQWPTRLFAEHSRTHEKYGIISGSSTELTRELVDYPTYWEMK